MATIDSFAINSVSREDVNFSFSASLTPAYNVRSNIYYEEVEEGSFWKFTAANKEISTITMEGSRTIYFDENINNTSFTLTGELTYAFHYGEEGWYQSGSVYKYTSSVDEGSYFIEYDSATSRRYYQYTGSDTIESAAGTLTYYYYNYWNEVWKIEWEDIKTDIKTAESIEFYPRPPAFSFNNCSSDNQWLVSEGIKSLIDNINEFATYATQWKRWNKQSSVDSCPGFSSGGKITATQMNLVHNYVGTGKSYSQGEIISAEMFNLLASTINKQT